MTDDSRSYNHVVDTMKSSADEPRDHISTKHVTIAAVELIVSGAPLLAWTCHISCSIKVK